MQTVTQGYLDIIQGVPPHISPVDAGRCAHASGGGTILVGQLHWPCRRLTAFSCQVLRFRASLTQGRKGFATEIDPYMFDTPATRQEQVTACAMHDARLLLDSEYGGEVVSEKYDAGMTRETTQVLPVPGHLPEGAAPRLAAQAPSCEPAPPLPAGYMCPHWALVPRPACRIMCAIQVASICPDGAAVMLQ